MRASKIGGSATARCMPVAVARTLPSPSRMAADVLAVARPPRVTSARIVNPAIGTVRPMSTETRARRMPGAACSRARTSSPVGGPPWQASGSHGPRAWSVGVNHSLPSARRSTVKNVSGTAPTLRRRRSAAPPGSSPSSASLTQQCVRCSVEWMRTTRFGASNGLPHVCSAARMHDSSSGSTIGIRPRRTPAPPAVKQLTYVCSQSICSASATGHEVDEADAR